MDMKKFDDVCRWISIIVSVVSIVFLLSLLILRCVIRVVIGPLLAMRSRSTVVMKMRNMMEAIGEDDDDDDDEEDGTDTDTIGSDMAHGYHHHYAYGAEDGEDYGSDNDDEEDDEEEEEERRLRILASRRSLQRKQRKRDGDDNDDHHLALFPPQMEAGIRSAGDDNIVDDDNNNGENTHDGAIVAELDHVRHVYSGRSASVLAMETGKSALVVSASVKTQSKWKNVMWRMLNVPKSYMALQKRCIFFLLLWDLVICGTNLAVRPLQQQPGMSTTKRNFIVFLTSVLEGGVLASGVWNVCIIVCIMFSSRQILNNFTKPATPSTPPYSPGLSHLANSGDTGRNLQRQQQQHTRSRARILFYMWIVFQLLPLVVFVFIAIFNGIARSKKVVSWQSLSFMISSSVIVIVHTVLVAIAIVTSIVCIGLVLRMFRMIKQVTTKRRTRRQGSAILRLMLYGAPFLVSTSFLILQRGLSVVNELILVNQYGLPEADKHYLDSPLYVPSQVFRGLYHIVLPAKPFIDAMIFIVISPWFVAMVKEKFLFRYLSAEEQQRIMIRHQHAAANRNNHQLGQPLMA